MIGYARMTQVMVLAVLLAGCAKQPGMIERAAPAPTGGGTATAPRPATPGASTTAPAAPVAARPAPAPAARPAPAEFVSLTDLADVHFDFDKYEIRAQDEKILEANAVWFRANAGHLILIEGHTDERGTTEYNLVLGDRRAKAARNYLVSRGVAANRITVVSYGEERGACTDHNERCWSRNRRAHFLVKRP